MNLRVAEFRIGTLHLQSLEVKVFADALWALRGAWAAFGAARATNIDRRRGLLAAPQGSMASASRATFGRAKGGSHQVPPLVRALGSPKTRGLTFNVVPVSVRRAYPPPARLDEDREQVRSGLRGQCL